MDSSLNLLVDSVNTSLVNNTIAKEASTLGICVLSNVVKEVAKEVVSASLDILSSPVSIPMYLLKNDCEGADEWLAKGFWAVVGVGTYLLAANRIRNVGERALTNLVQHPSRIIALAIALGTVRVITKELC